MVKLNYNGKNFFFDEKEMLESGSHYHRLCSMPLDINEHLPTLKKYAEECESVTEMGVRFACSTWAFIEAKPKKINCIDIRYDFFEPSEKSVRKMCEKYHIDFNWITGDTLKIEIDNTDLLFIDTLHTYNQLYLELIRHSEKVKKYIILHDTVTFGERDEYIYEHASDITKSKFSKKSGLKSAIQDFLSTNSNWFIKEIFLNNNGLTILQKRTEIV